MPNGIAFAETRVGHRQRSTRGWRLQRAGPAVAWSARATTPRKVMLPKISVTGLGDYTRNVGYKTGAITYEFETKTFNYDCGIACSPT